MHPLLQSLTVPTISLYIPYYSSLYPPPPGKPRIDRTNVKDVVIKTGQQYLYDIDVSGEPKPTNVWTFNNKVSLHAQKPVLRLPAWLRLQLGRRGKGVLCKLGRPVVGLIGFREMVNKL